jgi:hypothetical protein
VKLYENVRPIDGGFRLGETETHYIDAVIMIYNWRLAMTPKASPLTYDRGWCYPGNSAVALLALRAAVVLWQREGGDEPIGWIKAVHTGEYREPMGVIELMDRADTITPEPRTGAPAGAQGRSGTAPPQ